MSKRVLVTGAGGFIGAAVARCLRDRGYQVIAAVGRRFPDRPAVATTDQRSLTVLRGDLADDGLTLPVDIDVVVHAAATSPAPDVTIADLVRDNVRTTERLLRHAAAVGVESIVYLSSLSIYGEIDVPEVDEHTAIRNPDCYGLTKRLGEQMLEAMTTRGLAIRLPGVLGRRSVRNWLTGVLAAAQAGRDIPVYNCESPFNNAVHIDDLATFIERCIADEAWRGFAAFPVGAEGTITVGDTVRRLIDDTGGRSRLIDKGARAPCFTISNRAAFAFGYRPRNIAEMLDRFVADNRS